MRREFHSRAATALVLRDVDELVRDHVATERTVEIEVIRDRDVTAVRERRRVEARRRGARGATAVEANVREIETEELRVLARHRAGQRRTATTQRTDRRADALEIRRARVARLRAG